MDPLATSQAELDAARDRVRRALMGRALGMTDGDLDALSSVSEADMPTAVALWQKHVPVWARGLIEATRDDEPS